jgi:hypothetical protein
VIAGVVILGVLGAVVANVTTGLPSGSLPGVALDSAALLILERAVAFFAAWMVFVVVVGRALRGHLPIEVSGRGLRYAEAEILEETRTGAEDAMRDVWLELGRLGREVAELQTLREASRTE